MSRLPRGRVQATWFGFAVGAGLVALSAAGCITSNNAPIGGVDASFPGFEGGTNDAAPSTGDAAPGTGDGSTGGCPAGWVAGAGGVCFVSMLGAWSQSTDANSNGPDTVATLGTVTATSVSVTQSHTGTEGGNCGCNGQHLNIPLGKKFSCASSTLAFDYATTVVMSTDNTPAIDIRFCTGPCPSVDGGIGGPNFYTGPQYVGSPFAPGTSS